MAKEGEIAAKADKLASDAMKDPISKAMELQKSTSIAVPEEIGGVKIPKSTGSI